MFFDCLLGVEFILRLSCRFVWQNLLLDVLDIFLVDDGDSGCSLPCQTGFTFLRPVFCSSSAAAAILAAIVNFEEMDEALTIREPR
jgi:hypothetical protein